tara:strand:- start:434 stop:568 length:135 start_codon:yes stop_codon:yes gene_type:complete
MVWLKKLLKKLKDFILWPYTAWKEHKEFKKKMEELRKRDPFIYR